MEATKLNKRLSAAGVYIIDNFLDNFAQERAHATSRQFKSRFLGGTRIQNVAIAGATPYEHKKLGVVYCPTFYKMYSPGKVKDADPAKMGTRVALVYLGSRVKDVKRYWTLSKDGKTIGRVRCKPNECLVVPTDIKYSIYPDDLDKEESYRHKARIVKVFYIDDTKVTNNVYEEVDEIT